MTSASLRGKAVWLPWVILVAAAGVLVLGVWLMKGLPKRSTSITNTTNTSTELRATYADLYDALWRQDEGTGSTLVTATLFPPALHDLLVNDTERSETEDQIKRATDALEANQVALVVTIDSINGAIADQDIQSASQLTADGQSADQPAWNALIASGRTINAPTGTSSQIGVMIFTLPTTVDWNQVADVQLTMRDLGGRSLRTFAWSYPGLANQIESN